MTNFSSSIDHPVVLEEVARKAPPTMGAQERLLAVAATRMQSIRSELCPCDIHSRAGVLQWISLCGFYFLHGIGTHLQPAGALVHREWFIVICPYWS